MNGALIIARLNSLRLVKKNILRILDLPMIIHLANRIGESKLIDQVIVATSNQPSDDPLEEVAEIYGIDCYRGSLDNLMERITGAAEQYNCDHIVEILGDNPLLHSELIDDVLDQYFSTGSDYCANISTDYGDLAKGKKLFPLGLRVQVYKLSVAKEYTLNPEYLTNGKHPSAFIFENPEKYITEYIEAKEKWSFLNKPELNFAVNYPKNLGLVKRIFEEHYSKDENFDLRAVFLQLEKEPDLYRLLGPEW